MSTHHEDDRVRILHGDCLDVLRELPDASVDAVVCDPPYGLEFMGKDWDSFKTYAGGNPNMKPQGTRIRTTEDGEWQPGRSYGAPKKNPRCRKCGGLQRTIEGRPSKCTCEAPDWDTRTREYAQSFQQWCEQWAAECLRVLKPGGHMLAFGGTRTWHRLACATEDAGFEVRDSIAWLYASGFPKSLNVGKDQRFCQCQAVPYSHDGDVLGVRQDVQSAAESRGSGEVVDVLPTVQREGTGARLGDARAQGASSAQDVHADVRGEEPGMEGRGDVPTREGQLHRPALRPLSSGSAGDGAVGRLRHGASTGHGPMDRPPVDADGVREPHRPESAEQRAVEPRAVSDERGPQARRGRPVCERCGKQDLTGFGTSLKPAFEPVVVARKPLAGTVAANVQQFGTGALNIDATRVGTGGHLKWATPRGMGSEHSFADDAWTQAQGRPHADATSSPVGRWPTNVVLDGSQADVLDAGQPVTTAGAAGKKGSSGFVDGYDGDYTVPYGDTGGPSRFFPVFRYQAKAPTRERPSYEKDGAGTAHVEAVQSNRRVCAICGKRPQNVPGSACECPVPDLRPDVSSAGKVAHPTVKPLDLMRWLVRLVTPPVGPDGLPGVVLDPFAGSGTTVEACVLEGFRCIAIEREAEYLPLIMQRLERQQPAAKHTPSAADALALFDFEEPA